MWRNSGRTGPGATSWCEEGGQLACLKNHEFPGFRRARSVRLGVRCIRVRVRNRRGGDA